LKKPTANPEYLDKLKQAILKLHGYEATYLESESILETFEGKTVWRGIVAIFQVTGHPTASRCYAWGYQESDGNMRYIAVLGVPPVDSPRKAVQVSIVADTKQKS
jgi:hypothetical protein